MRKYLKIFFFILLVLKIFFDGITTILIKKSPILTYDVSRISIPIFLSDKNIIPYNITQIKFENIGDKKATAVKISIALPQYELPADITITTTPAKNALTDPNIIISKDDDGNTFMRYENGMGRISIDGILKTSPFEAITDDPSYYKFREKNNGSALKRHVDTTIDTAYFNIEKINPGESGSVFFTNFTKEVSPKNILFESNECEGVSKNSLKFYETPLSKRIFNIIIFVITILYGITEIWSRLFQKNKTNNTQLDSKKAEL